MNERFDLQQLVSRNQGRQTWLARDRQTGNRCLVKIVLPQAHEVWKHQMKTEIEVLSLLDSLWIPSLLASGMEDGCLYAAMQYLDGITLAKWLQSRPSRSMRRRVFLQIVRLIQCVHQAGYLYLDLKADNIMICSGHACLVDFNGALRIGSHQLLLSNPAACPPEASKGAALDERADMPGLGRLYQKMLGNSRISWTCLQEDPGQRFGSLEDLAHACTQSMRLKKYGAVALACAGAVVFACSPMFSQDRISMTDPSQKRALELSPDLMDAWQLSLAISAGTMGPEDFASPLLWKQAARKAVEVRHQGLSQWLLEHAGSEVQDSTEYIQLQLTAGQPVPSQQITELLEQAAKAQDALSRLEDLCGLLCSCSLGLQSDQMELLARRLEQMEEIESSQGVVFLETWMLAKQENKTCPPLPDCVEQAASATNQGKEMLSLYRRSK